MKLNDRFSEAVVGVGEAMSIKYNNIVYELKQRGEEVTVLSLGEAYFDIPLLDFEKLPYPAIYHYGHSRGVQELRDLLAEFFAKEYNFNFDPAKEILVTAGSKAAIHMSLMAILNPGDEVIVPEPAWVSYTEQIKLCYGEPVGIPYDVDPSDYPNYFTDKTKAVIFNNPHNPRGINYTRKEIAALYDACRERDIWLLSDEAYSEFVPEGSEFVSLGQIDVDKTHSIVFNSISKNYGISGWRLGYVIANEKLISQVVKVNQHLITCPPTILQYYLAEYFYDILEITNPQIKKLINDRATIAEYMRGIGLDCLPGDATMYFFVSIAPSKLSSEEFCDLLLDQEKICVVPGVGYGESCDKFVRVSVGTESIETIKGSLSKLQQLAIATR